jgi:hypothetical protein
MKIKSIACLLALTLLPACTTTQTSQKGTLEERTRQQYASANAEPAPPAEGPQDIPSEGPGDPNRNPALVPSPLLRESAASGSP